MTSSKAYRFICISSFRNIAAKDSFADYLHIHVLKSSYLEPIENLAPRNPKKNFNNILYQWGSLSEKDFHNRSAKISDKEIRQYGQIGIGSAARGDDEKNRDFIGGGEGFLVGSQSFRITKGNTIFKSSDDQKYWIFQVADFSNAQRVFDLNGYVALGREDLTQVLREKSSGKPFVAVFDAVFKGRFFARSNGIFPEDIPFVKEPNKVLFNHKIKGGHLVGGSNNKSDIESLKEKFNPKEIGVIDFSCRIISAVFLKPIEQLKIAKKNGSFKSYKPSGVVNMTQEKCLERNNKNGENNNNWRWDCRLYNGYRVV